MIFCFFLTRNALLLILQLNSSIDLITGFDYDNLRVEKHRLNLAVFFCFFSSEVLLLNTSKTILSRFQPFLGCFLSHCTAVPWQKIESTVLQNTNQHISTAAAFIYILFLFLFQWSSATVCATTNQSISVFKKKFVSVMCDIRPKPNLKSHNLIYLQPQNLSLDLFIQSVQTLLLL